MRFVLVRHGQSTNNLLWSSNGDDAGRDPDTRLTPLGEEQAAALAAYATEPGLPWRPTQLYASAMARAIQTAAPLADALDLPLRLHADLHEVGGPYGYAPGTRDRVPHPGSGRSLLAALSDRLELPGWVAEDGWWRGAVESGQANYVARADRLIASLRAAHDDADVVALVSHGGFGNVLLARLLGVDGGSGVFELANTAITLVRDTPPELPWRSVAVRVNWLPHLSGHQLSDSDIDTP